MSPTLEIIQGDCVEEMRKLPAESVQCCVTSPPYWGLRDYGVEGQLGLEKSPEEWVVKIVQVFKEVRRVLRNDGTLWMNLGDSYNGQGARSPNIQSNGDLSYRAGGRAINVAGLKQKDLIGLPWMAAFALRADGWYLRCDVIWNKTNPMPESVVDRPTKSHEYLFLLSKSPRYFYDAEAVKEGVTGNAHRRGNGINPKATKHDQRRRIGSDREPRHLRFPKPSKQNESFSGAVNDIVTARNKRSVWTLPISPYSEAHFATYPPDLIKPCILAGSRPNDTVIDPFAGSGTTGMVALELGRNAVLIELNPEYIKLIERRCEVTPGLPLEAVA